MKRHGRQVVKTLAGRQRLSHPASQRPRQRFHPAVFEKVNQLAQFVVESPKRVGGIEAAPAGAA
jgi:hypothetical protein